MKKLLTFITLTLALICLLASCGGQKDEHTHDFGEWKVTKAPTCTEEGSEVRYCDCGEKQTEVVVALGHTFADWVTVKEPTVTEEGLKERTCACGEKDTVIVEKLIASEGLEYELNEDGQGYTVAVGTCTDTDIVISATYKDLPVTSIGDLAFYGCTGLTSIAIPGSVTSIDWYAFENCTGLTDVYYTGTESEWAEIIIDSDNDNLKNATIHYNYVPEN